MLFISFTAVVAKATHTYKLHLNITLLLVLSYKTFSNESQKTSAQHLAPKENKTSSVDQVMNVCVSYAADEPLQQQKLYDLNLNKPMMQRRQNILHEGQKVL